MSSAGVHELQIMALAVNYHRWMARTVERHVGRRVLEVGGGLGNMSVYWADRDRFLTMDPDPECFAHLSALFAERKNVRVLNADITSQNVLSDLQGETLDTVVCMNVLEHIEDDTTALANMWRALAPGGRLVLLVPAHPSLYGSLDEVVGHYRRYSRRDLSQKAAAAGFKVRSLRYFNSLGAAGRFLIGRVGKQQETGRGQVLFYDRWVVPFLRPIEALIAPPFGQSLILVGERE